MLHVKMKRHLHGLLTLRWNMQKRLAALIFFSSAFLIYVSLRVGTTVPWIRGKPYTPHVIDPLKHTADQTKSPEPTAVSKIVLMTYGRSGSTFTSDVIRQDPRIFYTFEPLYNLVRRTLAKSQAVQTLFARAGEQTRADLEQSSIDLLEIFLTCGFEALNVTDINNYQLRNSEDSRLLWGCIQKPKDNWRPGDIVNCFLQARKTCLSRPVKMVKTIRLRGTAARKMLSRYDDLKILYLIRDPRGTLTSQRAVFNAFKWENVGNFSTDYCQVLREDLAVLGHLLAEYPQRVKILRYETLAANPLQISEDLYSFLGLNFTREVKAFVYNRTMAGLKENSAYGTLRSNSSEAAYSWRYKIGLEAAQIVDRNCKDIYETMGYVPVRTQEELTDMSYSLRRSAVFGGRQL